MFEIELLTHDILLVSIFSAALL